MTETHIWTYQSSFLEVIRDEVGKIQARERCPVEPNALVKDFEQLVNDSVELLAAITLSYTNLLRAIVGIWVTFTIFAWLVDHI